MVFVLQCKETEKDYIGRETTALCHNVPTLSGVQIAQFEEVNAQNPSMNSLHHSCADLCVLCNHWIEATTFVGKPVINN